MRTFLGNHSVWACDFLLTYDIWFRPIFALFIVDVKTRTRSQRTSSRFVAPKGAPAET